MRKTSPNRTALLIALTASALFFITSVLFVDTLNSIEAKTITIIAFFLSVFGLTFYLIKLLLMDKIGSIYASIKNLSPNRISRYKIRMNEDVVSQTEKDVESWVVKRKEEIEKLKEQEKFRREFIGNLAHELKTPLFNIQGYVLTLLEGGLEDKSVNRNFLEKAANSVDRLTELVKDLDVIAKIEATTLNLDIKPFSFLELVQDTIDEANLLSEEKSISVSFDKEYEKPFMVLGDRQKIQQVVFNLLINAINYGKSNGKVVFSLSRAGDKITLSVKDNGVGIAEEELSRIFERFYRVDKSRSSNVKGTGLGLAIVKHILDAHGTTVYVKSTLKKGSSFSFSLRKAN